MNNHFSLRYQRNLYSLSWKKWAYNFFQVNSEMKQLRLCSWKHEQIKSSKNLPRRRIREKTNLDTQEFYKKKSDLCVFSKNLQIRSWKKSPENLKFCTFNKSPKNEPRRRPEQDATSAFAKSIRNFCVRLN